MRLIDADAFKNWLCEKFKVEDSLIFMIQGFIAEQPTAFDLESVIEKLQTELNLADKEKERCIRENPLQFDSAKGYSNGMAVALQLLKSAVNATNGENGGQRNA